MQVREVRLLVNEPVPVPSDVLVERDIVGLMEVSQTTPLAVTEAPPSAEMFPPPEAVVWVMLVMEVVVRVGPPNVVNVSSAEYAVPVVLMA